jgi:DNA-directed RNA polymerase specialized sigma24 family protein
MLDDVTLLRRFVAERSDTAFRELVAQRIQFVYAAARRQVGGDEQLVNEIVQNVFLDLARKAQSLVARPSLAGWLFTSTRFAASKALRSRARRLAHVCPSAYR